MPEVAASGQDHGDLVFVAGANGLVITARATGLDDGRDAGGRGLIRTVTEREECIGGENRTLGARSRFLDGDPDGIQPAHLARAHSHDPTVSGEDDRVGLHRRTDAPGEGEVAPFALGRGAPGRNAAGNRIFFELIPVLNEESSFDPAKIAALWRRVLGS